MPCKPTDPQFVRDFEHGLVILGLGLFIVGLIVGFCFGLVMR
jgi:hypothetical protein